MSSPAALPPDIAVCNFDYIDEHGNIIHPRPLDDVNADTEPNIQGPMSKVYGLRSSPAPLPPAGEFFGDDRYRAHRRSGYLEFLVHLLIGTSWTTMTAVLFRRTLLEKTGLFREDVPGALADRLWAYKSAVHSDTIVVPETLATWRQHYRQGSAAYSARSMEQMRKRRHLWRAMVETVRECLPELPADWREDPDLSDKLLWNERRHYLDLYSLSRTHLRHHPCRFIKGLMQAARLEPGYLWQRLASGLDWPLDHGLSESDYLRKLIEERL